MFGRRTPKQCARLAAALEADAERYPEERGEILLEAATQWNYAGETDRALALLRTVIPGGGEDGQFARVEVAALRFEAGDAEAAFAELATLRAERPLHVAPCHMAAELLEENGHLDDALQWFNVTTTRLDDGELARACEDPSAHSYASVVLMGRRRVREALGLPNDDLDDAAPEPTWNLFPTDKYLLDDLDEPEGSDVVRTLFWPRSELPGVRANWPGAFGPDDDGDYHRRLETDLRELAARGAHRVELVPGTADGLAEFALTYAGDAESSDTRQAYLEDRWLRGHLVTWPPPRNGPCWCGSGAKYKKCCGKPAA